MQRSTWLSDEYDCYSTNLHSINHCLTWSCMFSFMSGPSISRIFSLIDTRAYKKCLEEKIIWDITHKEKMNNVPILPAMFNVMGGFAVIQSFCCEQLVKSTWTHLIKNHVLTGCINCLHVKFQSCIDSIKVVLSCLKSIFKWRRLNRNVVKLS